VTPVSSAEIPSQSLLDSNSIKTAYFSDCYRASLRDHAMSMPKIFFAIFGHHPLWLKALLLTRNRAAAIFGLAVPSASSILKPKQKARYNIGENIGPWPIFELQENELIVGRNNSHLDFRLSVLKAKADNGPYVTVTTICNVHNIYGKLYLGVIVPFHKRGVKRLLASAVQSQRI
jgi:Protein of unknown function (DUF2867)